MTVQPTRDQLRALADAATPGPWLPHARYVWTSELGGIIQNWSEDANAAADMEFIAAARTALPALLDALDQAEAEVKRLSWKCGHLADKYAQDTDELRQEADQAEAERDNWHSMWRQRGIKHLAAEKRATRAEARIQAVEALCDAAEDPDQWPPRPVIHGGEPFPASLMVDAIRRALDGDQ